MQDNLGMQTPYLGPGQPVYPHLLQLCRTTAATVPGPAPVGASVLAANLYLGFVEQLRTDTLLPRDREPCLVDDVAGFGLPPGYYLCRLAGAYSGLPVYETVGAGAGSNVVPGTAGLTPSQVSALPIYLSTAQIAVLNNLNPCQLSTLVSVLSVPQQQILTSNLTAPQLSNLVGTLTQSQLGTIVSTLNVPQLQALTSALAAPQVQTLVQAVTAPQLATIVSGLTAAQLQALANYPSATVAALVNGLTTGDLATLLGNKPLPAVPLLQGYTQTAGFTSGTQSNIVVTGTLVNVSTLAATTLTGMVPASTAAAQTVTLVNTGTSVLNIANLSASSSSNNQFQTSTGTTVVIPAASATTFTYDPLKHKWIDVGVSSAMTGGTFTGGTLTSELITTASTTGGPGLNLQVGVAPTSPANGDVWVTTTGIFAEVNGTTYNLTTGGTVGGTNQQLLYNNLGAEDGVSISTWNGTQLKLTDGTSTVAIPGNSSALAAFSTPGEARLSDNSTGAVVHADDGAHIAHLCDGTYAVNATTGGVNVGTGQTYHANGTAGTTGSTLEGDVVAAGIVTSVGVSDARLKRAVTPLGPVLDGLLRLHPVRYSWDRGLCAAAGGVAHDDRPHLGLLAQEVAAAFPEASQTARTVDGLDIASYSLPALIAVLVGAVQELAARITTPENRR